MGFTWISFVFICGLISLSIAKNVVSPSINGNSDSEPDDVDKLRNLTSCPLEPAEDGIYIFTLHGLNPFHVLCDSQIAGPGYAVIASRSNVSLNFFRNWKAYKNGFGDLSGDFFIGLDKLHAMTKSQNHELYIQLEDFEGNIRFARYDKFYIENENVSYKMSKLGTYTGDAGDSLANHKGYKFTTFDNDNDSSDKNCAVEKLGAWWYKDCHSSNLFGMYLEGLLNEKTADKGMSWDDWRGHRYSYKSMKMMVRPKCCCT